MKDIAVIGAGYWGKNIIRNFYELGVLNAICEIMVTNPLLATYSDVKHYSDFTDCLSDPSIHGVAIATPAEMHYSMAKRALEANKHVLVEKPLCLSVPECQHLNELAQQRNKKLMVGHLLHYHPAFQMLKSMIKKSDLGKIQYIYSNRLNFGKIRTEENVLWSLAPHDISVLLSLAGQMPERVSTSGGHYCLDPVSDVSVTQLCFSNNINAHIFVSWLHPFKEQRLVVAGTEGMAVFNDTAETGRKLLFYPHKVHWGSGNVPMGMSEDPIPVVYEELEPLKQECQHFVDCIRLDMTPITDGKEGASVLRVLSACQESYDQGGEWVYLSEQKASTQIHATAHVDEGATIGKGTKIWHFSHIMKGSSIGEHCNIGQNVVVGPNVSIGCGVKIQNNVSVYEGVTLEDNVFCGPSMVFTNVLNPRSEIARMSEAKPTRVKRGATIGANATLVCGNTIGEYAMIGAGAVITKDVPDRALMVGVPAKQIGWVCDCGVTLASKSAEISCKACGKEYGLDDNKLMPKILP